LTYCHKKVNFKTSFGLARFDTWHTWYQWRNFCVRVDKNITDKIYSYFWSLGFWWKFKIRECLGPYCGHEVLRFSCHVFNVFLISTFFLHLWLLTKWKFNQKNNLYFMLIVDVSASPEAFVETVCLIAVRRSFSGRTGCRRCGRVGSKPKRQQST